MEGYHSGLFGKWGLGNVNTTGYPTAKKFNKFYGVSITYAWWCRHRKYSLSRQHASGPTLSKPLYDASGSMIVEAHELRARSPFFR